MQRHGIQEVAGAPLPVWKAEDSIAIMDACGNLHESSKAIGLNMPGFLIEFLCDTTRAALNLILSGTMERHPNIRWIMAHAGGFLPYVAWRVSLANFMPIYTQESASHRLGRALRRPILALAERMRKR